MSILKFCKGLMYAQINNYIFSHIIVHPNRSSNLNNRSSPSTCNKPRQQVLVILCSFLQCYHDKQYTWANQHCSNLRKEINRMTLLYSVQLVISNIITARFKSISNVITYKTLINSNWAHNKQRKMNNLIYHLH